MIDLKFSSYASKYTVYAKMAYWKETPMRVWRRNSHPALTQRIDISDSKAVIQYVECLYTTCSFQVTSVGMHKM